MSVTRRLTGVAGLAHDTERGTGIDHIASLHVDGFKVGEVVAHTVVAEHRHVLPAPRRRIVGF